MSARRPVASRVSVLDPADDGGELLQAHRGLWRDAELAAAEVKQSLYSVSYPVTWVRRGVMVDRDPETYATPPEAAPSKAETRGARERMATGIPTLMASVFLSFVLVAVVILSIRYLL